MKILHVDTSDASGGAAIAAMRHCEAMRAAGIDAQFLCIAPQSQKTFSHGIDSWVSLNRLRQKVFNKLNYIKAKKSSPYASWSVADYGFDISNHPLVLWADEIWIHWVNGGMLSIKSIAKLLRTGKSITWYLHDMWPLTGGCHYSLGCNGFQKKCGNCHLLFNHQGSDRSNDISYQQITSKLKSWTGYNNLKLLVPSKWLADLAKRSALFGNGQTEINVLPNPIDTNLFAPFAKSEARKKLSLPENKHLILFGAHNVNDPYKGMHYLLEALPLLKDFEEECIVFGQSSQALHPDSFPIKIHPVGSVTSAEDLRVIYSAADLFVTPSIADNYPNVLIEAMACGTPCVGFNIGGIPEIIQDGISGLLSPDVSSKTLADAIHRALPHAQNFGIAARKQILQNNSYENYWHYGVR